MTDPAHERLAAASAALLEVLVQHDPVSAEAVTARAEHAEALLDAGAVEDAFYAAEELVKDCLRAGEETSPTTVRARAVLTRVEAEANARGMFRR